MPVRVAYERAALEGRPLNYGYSASWAAARGQVLSGITPDATLAGVQSLYAEPSWQRSSSAGELAAWLQLLDLEVESGALGIGVLLGYAPQSSPQEFLAVAQLVAAAGVPTYTHVRELFEVDPTTPVDGSHEVAQAAALTGAAMHHCHVNSTSRRHIDRVLQSLDDARTTGARLTVEAYPYGAGSTAIGASFLRADRLASWGLAPSAVMILASGERIADARRLEELRAADPGAACIVEFLDEDEPADRALLRRALTFPDSIVASDAVPITWSGQTPDSRIWPLPPGATTHPRTAGSFCKSLRLMVRETSAWTWSEAFRRCSYLPARVLDDVSSAARHKGYLSTGADADLVVLDPVLVTDNATFVEPARPSTGVEHLFVGGEFVIRDGSLVPDAYPGRALRGQPR